MKKLVLAAIALLISTGALAQDYSGVWRADISDGSFAVIRQNGQAMIIAGLDSDGGWDAYLGTVSGNLADVSTVIGRVNVSMTVRFQSNKVAVATLERCTPYNLLYVCALPVGTQITYRKIF